MQRDAVDYAAKAEEMRRRASAASTDTLRAMYLKSASSYDSLANRGGSRSVDPAARVEALEAELAGLKQSLVAVENALVICIRMLRKNVPAFAQAAGNLSVEPHPDTPAERVEELMQASERIRRIFGQTPVPTPGAANGVPEPVADA